MLNDDYFEDFALELEREFVRPPFNPYSAASQSRLLIPSDWPDSSRPETDVFGEPLIADAWYWGWVEHIGSSGEELWLHIVSGPLSPLTFANAERRNHG